MEWSEIESAYAIKEDQRSRDQVLTESVEKRNLNESVATFVSDVAVDLVNVFSHSKTVTEFISSVFTMLTIGDRGIIFGTLLVTISLSLLALHRTDMKNGDA